MKARLINPRGLASTWLVILIISLLYSTRNCFPAESLEHFSHIITFSPELRIPEAERFCQGVRLDQTEIQTTHECAADAMEQTRKGNAISIISTSADIGVVNASGQNQVNKGRLSITPWHPDKYEERITPAHNPGEAISINGLSLCGKVGAIPATVLSITTARAAARLWIRPFRWRLPAAIALGVNDPFLGLGIGVAMWLTRQVCRKPVRVTVEVHATSS